MSFPTLTYPDFLENPTREELEALVAQIQGYLSIQHKADGSHSDITGDSLVLTANTATGATGNITADGFGKFDGDLTALFGTGNEVGIGTLSSVNGTSLLPAEVVRQGILVGGVSSGMFIEKRAANSPYTTGSEFAVWSLGFSTSKPIFRFGSISGVMTMLDGGSGASLVIGDSSDPISKVHASDFFEQGRSTALGNWANYTPTWTAAAVNPAIGNGTLTGRYTIVGDTVRFQVLLTAGSTTTFGTGAWSFTFPQTAVSGTLCGGDAIATDSSAGQVYIAHPRIATTTTFDLLDNASPAAQLAAATPFAWATSDTLFITGAYEMA